MLPIKYLTIHCAASPEGKPLTAKQMNDIAIRRFSQISYHHVIELDGTTTRTLKDTQRGAHVGGKNTGNIGIVYVGGVTADGKKAKDTRTPEQKRALKALVTEYKKKYPGIVVRGHRDWPGVAKDCPSFDVKYWIEQGMPE